MGAPDLALRMPAEFTVAADRMEDTQEVTLATGTTEARWVRAVDLLPGTPSIVRSAVISLKAAPAPPSPSPTPEHVLVRWVPGHDPEPIDSGTAVRLPAGAELVARIHYKKTWQLTSRDTVARVQDCLCVCVQTAARRTGQADGSDPTIGERDE